MRKNFLTVIALIAVLAMVLAGCGSKDEAVETTAAAVTTTAAAEAPALGLSDWTLTPSTWSSPNGATVTLTATPWGYAEGYSAIFVVRLEGEDVANVACDWNGETYTASAELNAADGLCYYVIMTAADGNTAEVPVNTPAEPTDETLLNLESSLNSYCSLVVEESAFDGSTLKISAGTAQVQTPAITDDGEAITISEANLVLSFDGEDLASQPITLAATDTAGLYELALTDITFDVPALENDQQLVLTLDTVLSNDYILNTAGSTFYYNDGEVLTAVG